MCTQAPRPPSSIWQTPPLLILLLNSVQVNIAAESGDMGILANHVPSIEQLKPGLIEIIEESGGSKQFFCESSADHLAPTLMIQLTVCTTVSGGFAVVQPDSQLSINAVEGYAIEDFSDEAVKSQISEASKIAGGSGSEQDIAEAKIELEVSTGLKLAFYRYSPLTGFGEPASSHEVALNTLYIAD
jgi:F0F1-type ATP synthase epsilon subunit